MRVAVSSRGTAESAPWVWRNSGFCRCGALARARGGMSLRTRKRTLHRAVRDGFAFYRGQRVTNQFVQRQFPQLYSKFAHQEPVQTHKPVHRTRPGQATRATRHQIFTWNSGGLSGETYDMLISLLERQNISVAHIQETHWSFSSTWSTDSFHCIHSGATKKGTAGVLTLIRKDLCKSTQIKFQHVVPGRLLLVRFPLGQTFLNLINVYYFCNIRTRKTVCSFRVPSCYIIWTVLSRASLVAIFSSYLGTSMQDCDPLGRWLGGRWAKAPRQKTRNFMQFLNIMISAL